MSIIGSTSGEPGETGRGGGAKKSKNRRVFFSRYLAANDASNTSQRTFWAHNTVPKDVKRSTPTQQPTIPWSSLLRQCPRQRLTLQLTQQGWGNYQELSCSRV